MAEIFPGTSTSIEVFEYLDVKLTNSIAQSRSRGNLVSEVQFADPYWAGEFRTVYLNQLELNEWEAFVSEVVDRKLAIDFIHPMYQCPSAYTVATTPGDGDATIASFPDGRTIAVTGLPSGLILRKGDRFSLVEGDTVGYFQVAVAVPSASAISQNVICTPRLPTGLFTNLAIFVYKFPKIRLRIDPNSWSAPTQGGRAVYGSFTAYEANRE